MIELWNSPFYTTQEKLDIAIGAIAYRDKVIGNLREQLKEKEMEKQSFRFDNPTAKHVIG